MKKRLILILISFIVLQSCSFKLTRVESIDGKKYWTRYYKDYNDRFDYQAKCIFKNNDTKQSFKKYYGDIFSDTIENLTYFQFDTTRIYLRNESNTFKNLFLYGIISPQTIYCELYSDCIPPENNNSFLSIPKNDGNYYSDYYGWKGSFLLFGDFKEIKSNKSSNKLKRFSFKQINSNGFSIFFFELTNEKANSETTLANFIKDSDLTFFKYGWSEI